ncbi:hypothetical protein [Larsenimonas rhizosphaerae]|uniref:Uncharacterized protein n=1 Tax=Larsenimonas rhizosphaerae TaxID=2944682 RepID=A0AA41ZL54_9GAMM|nr:hypothetical protein [Larsenimonas rhizosphaerae]MCX2522765.1 hypothetical protein [Larsenimonas rhizosphaerae]
MANLTIDELKAKLEPMGFTIVKMENEDRLFDGDDALFKRLAGESQCYGEYGVGQSTRWMAKHTNARLESVESDERWAVSVRTDIAVPERATVRYCDTGPVGDWGRALSYKHRDRFEDYINGWWPEGISPDLVLVDGRFRVACFLTSLLNAAPGTRLLFDDYCNRPYYHLVEEFVTPAESCGRQMLFERPEDTALDLEKLVWTRDRFMFVME